jgi:hypothetical protein
MCPEGVRDLFAGQPRGDVASVGAPHPVEDRVQSQRWLNDDNILVVLADVTASGSAAAP